MNCTATSVNLSFDKDNRLSSTLSRVSKADTNKRMVLAALLLNNDFKKYLLDNITISDIRNEEVVDFDNFTENDYYKINQNKLGSLLDAYYKDNFHVIDNSTTDKGSGKLSGFRTASAKTVARNYTATILVDEYAKDAKKPKNERRKTIEIIAAVNDKILGTFYDRATAFATQVKNDNSFSKEDKALAKKYLDAVAELDYFNTDIRSKQQWYRAYKSQQEEIAKRLKEIKTAIESNKENTNNAELKREYRSLAEQYAKLKKATEDITKEYNDKKLSYPLLKIAKYAYAQQFITTVADRNTVQHGERLLNYANLVMQTRTNANEWYFSVFNTKTMTSIAKVFNQVGDITEFITEEDNNFDEITSEYDGRSIDETARTWEDALAKNFTQNVDNDLKIILSTIPKLDNRYNTRESVQSIDTNNELGVPTYMPVSYVITQIFSFCDTSNIDSFISSIENKANSVTALYGLGKIVQMMKNDRVFANRMFANFAKPIFKKVILTVSDITDSNGLSFDWSNKAATPTTQLIYSFSNKLRATYNTSYSTADITTINNAINSFIKNNDKNALKNVLYETIKKYLPNINKDAFSKYFERTTDDTACEAFARDIRSIIEGVGKLKTEINRRIDIINNTNETNYAEYKKALKEYNALDEASKKTAKQPVPKEKQYFDYSSVDFSSATYSSLISLAKRLTEFSDSSAMLNSSNAEGNSTSSVGKNCFISRFFERINSSTKEDVNAGLRAMLEEFTQGTENGKENQYSNNPILFGLKDINGMPVRGCEGLFIKTATGYDINPNAKQLISYYLFDGSKSTTNGKASGYAKLSKLDYFITQYIAFGRSVEEIINDIKSTKVGNLNTAVYSTRIGSDAPKIFNVRAPRYTNSQLRLCLYNHVIDEINMMAKGLNGLFVSAGDNLFNIKENLHGLPAVAFYRKEVAKNGKLTGTLFNPNRLFELDSYDAGKEILSVLSLYGEGDQEGAIRIGQDGKLILKPNQTIVNNGQELEIKLSNEQKTAILNIVDKWINAYLQEASNKLDYFKNVFINNGIEYDQATINNMLLNQVNMNIIYDDIFEGDYKFYGKARTFLKRTKETQAGGDGYAGYDINKYEYNDVHELESNGVKETITIPSSKELNEDGSNKRVSITINGRQLVARNGWRGVTIYNTVKASDYAAQLQQELEKIFIAQGMNEQVAHEKSVKYAQGYGYSAGTVKGSTTVINDAQSYITFEEFIRRRYADGTINEYADLIELLNGDTPIEDIDFDAINKRIQVQKNFYYDKVFDAETGLYMPRQIKNAEFVLIPKLLPEGSELRRVHDWMMKHDIGQLNTEETSKAAKKTVFTIWDEATGDFHEDFEDKFDDSYIENYQYQYLYKQQEVPQHMIDEHNKAGIQIMKKIIDNIIDTTDINNSEREQLVAWANDFQSAYTANIKEDFNSFLDAMGWKYDTDTGHIINASNNSTELNFDDFYNRARQEAARLGMDSNFIEYLMPNEFGVPVMPNYITTVANKLESIAQSIYNNRITRQTLPGWHGAQITSVGYSKKLEFDPVTGVMQVYLPRWSNLIPKGKTEEENAKILEQIQKEGLDIHLAYRMPTEGKQSISVIRVVGFTNEALGSTIVVPNEWVIQTGSDFDVDSIYGISWEMYKTTDKKGNVTLHKIPFEENTTTSEERYINYVNNTINNRVKHDDIGNEIEDSIKEVKDRLNYVNERNELNEEFNDINDKRNELYGSLPTWAKSIIKTANIEFRKSVDGKLITDIRTAYPEINVRLTQYINENNIKDDILEIVKEYMDYQTATIDVINAQEGIPAFDLDAYRSAKSEAIQQVINNAKQAYLRKVEKAAKEVGLEDFETFTKRPFVEQLSKRARNNFILDRMIKIMNSANSREEQYGRSNFEKITNGDGTGANDIIDKLYGESSRKRSPYNPLDQTDYQEDVMGGARLKALSVMWDNFCSKNNKVRAILKEDLGIEVILENDIEDSQIEYNFDEIEKSYDDSISNYNGSTAKNKTYTLWQHGTKDYRIKEARIKKLMPLIDNITEDDTLITIPYREFAKYNAKIDNGNNDYDEVKTEIKEFLLHELDKEYDDMPFIKGEFYITDTLYKLLKQTTPEEFIGILNGYDTLIKDETAEERTLHVTNNIINSFIEQNGTDENTLIAAIKSTFAGDEYYNRRPHKIKGSDKTFIDNVIIDKEVIDNEEFKKNYPKAYAILLEKYNAQNEIVNITPNSKKIKFTARRIGFSNNNRNVVGELITTYSSQTTAHHLDAVKMGSVPNVNEYTFNTYKLLSTLGIDYETIISFIRQPAVTRIVNNNNLINSIFLNSKSNPIKMSINQIAVELKLAIDAKHNVTEETRLVDTIEAIKANASIVDAFNTLFGIDISSMEAQDILNIRLPLDKRAYFDRIRQYANKQGDVYEQAAFDLGVIFTFNSIRKIADKVNRYIKVTNADKFGAPVSMRETRQMINDVNKLRTDDTFDKDDVGFIDLIYPEKEGYSGIIDVDKSEYPSIAAIYNYATITSYNTNKQIFITEREEFADAENFVQKALRHKFTEDEYKAYKRYIIGSLYSQIPVILSPVTLDKRGNLIMVQQDENQSNNEGINANQFWNSERSRIYGYGIATNGDFQIANVNKPTAKEIERFRNLTPAQKVLFIQTHFDDNAGVFNYLNITLFNPADVKYKGINRQYISYNDQVGDIEDLYYLFDKAFFNKNPLIKLAAIDLIKYAFIAEGFNFKTGYISKIIPNDVLYTNINEGGTGIIRSVESLIYGLAEQIQTEDFITDFARSHSDMIDIQRMPSLPEQIIDKYTGLQTYKYHNITTILRGLTRPDGLIHIDATVDNKLLTNLITKLNLKDNNSNYVRINTPIDNNRRTINLYKIQATNPIYDNNDVVAGYQDYFLIPLNILDSTENFEYSYNEYNNTHNSYQYYMNRVTQISDIANNARQTKVDSKVLRHTINKAVPSVKAPVGKYTGETQDIHTNPNLLSELVTTSDEFLRGGVEKLVNSIINHAENTEEGFNEPLVEFIPNTALRQILGRGDKANQTFELNNGSTITVTIEHQTVTKRMIDGLTEMMNGKRDAKEYATAVKQMKDSKTLPAYADLYRITRAKESKETLDKQALNAATELIIDEAEVDESTGQTPRRGTRLDIDGVSRQIINEIRYDARKNKDAAAERFVKEIDRRRVNPYLESSRRTNRGNIYRAAARYYQTAANSLINALDGFEIAGEIYSFDDAHMYEALAEHDEYFSEVAKIILDGITFGNRIADILNLDLSAEDMETKAAIESIIHNINAVKTNKKLVAALDNIINIYFKKYSTNPLIAEDILKLRETFGDLDAIDFWVGDPFDIDNNEVQTILKQVYSTFAKAEMFDTRRNVKEWKDKLAEIEAMQESLDMDKIIDTKHGRIRQDYNEDFIKEKNRLLDELNEAKAHKNDSIEAFNRYIDAKYAKDRFYQQHFEQRIVDDYYKEELDAREKAMRIPGKYYYTYVRLVDELYNTSNSTSLSADELAARKKQIIEKLNILKNDNTDEARALNEYISKKKELQEKYFTSKEYEGFTEIYERYDRYIKKYDAANITKTLEEKLQDVGYREAYNWIRENGNLRFVGEEAIKLNKAFIALRGSIDSVPKQIVKQIKTIPGAVDDNGIINPMMLNDEQIKQLHDAEEKEFEDYYGDPLGDGVLIKINPSNLPIVDKSKATTAKEKDEITYAQYKDNRLKKQIIAKINATLYKVIDRNTGKIVFEDLFNDDIVSNDERDALIRNYNELRALSNNPFKKFKKIKGEAYTEEIYEAGYYEALNYYNLHLKNTRQGAQWIKLFTEKDAAGDIHPNRLIFGFKKWADKFVNAEKTEAVKYIHDNVEFVHTEYYDRASREAAAKGPEYYKDWFRKNHVYNPYSHTWTPLRIWSTISAKPGTALANSYQYVPTGDNLERSVKGDYVNLKYSEFGSNYKKGDSKYDNPIVLNDKEKAYKKLLIQTLNKYATTYSGKRFVGQGFLPRERKTDIDSRWAATNALGMFGVSYKSATASDDFYDNVDYSHDREAEMKMLQLIKDKGSQKLKKLPLRQSFNSEAEYQKELARVKKENEAIQKQNEAIDSANLNTDWNGIMERFIHNATIFNSRQNAKPYLYLLLEDLANNNAYMIKGMWNKRVVKDSFSSSDDRAEYKTVKQERTYNLVQNLARRMLYSQHHEQGTARNVANFMQNMASAKYMITNLYGGIANVTTGATNIAMESAAGEYFGHGDLASAEGDYWTAVPDIVKNLYSDKADNLTNAFIKLFNVVEFDQIIQYGDGGNEMSEYVKRARNALYGFQSAGEHIMQNTVMLAMLKSNRLYTDANGVRRIGDFKDFAQGIEKLAMQKTLEDYPQLKVFYDTFRKTLKFDTAKKLDIDSGRKDINRMFLNSLKYSNDESTKALYRKIATEYAKNRNELMNTEKTKFLEAKTVESLFELKDGQAVLKEKVIAEFNAEGINRIGDLEQLVGGFKRKVEAVNKKIHGIYDKISAGYLESKWYGSIVMQYHKHLYMGIMKRWRRKGYYSEIKGSRERGVYQDIIDFLSMEFEGIGDRINQQVQNGDNIALASIQNVIGTTIETIANIQFNWNTLSNAEKANCKRQLGELGGILASMLVAMVLFGGWDDDEIKDSGMLSSCLYLADRLYSETSMYTPWGLVSEAKTAWSSPIASTGEATDLLKACQLLTQALADPDFDATYKTGQYAGKNKFRVLLRRNMPGVRPYDRIMNITRNNQYYKIGESQIGMNIAKTFGESLRGE